MLCRHVIVFEVKLIWKEPERLVPVTGQGGQVRVGSKYDEVDGLTRRTNVVVYETGTDLTGKKMPRCNPNITMCDCACCGLAECMQHKCKTARYMGTVSKWDTATIDVKQSMSWDDECAWKQVTLFIGDSMKCMELNPIWRSSNDFPRSMTGPHHPCIIKSHPQ